jgi:predicted HAD superfamily Cof-like phosphohydrolase
MTLSAAMSKAQDLHPPRTLPKVNAWDNEPDVIAAFNALNRIRASITSDDWPMKVFAFHRLYGVPGGEGPISVLPAMRRILRRRLRHEENKETDDAIEAGDVIEHIDGLLDLIYVAIGELLEIGLTPLQINLAMEEVHASNMTKVDDDGKPLFDEGGKVLKGGNYVKCDLALVLDYDQGE